MNPPTPPDPAVSPRIECRRCGTEFICDWPELSGAVICPACETTASLSRENAKLVHMAASERRKRGMPSSRKRSAYGNEPAPEPTEEELHQTIRLKARAFRRHADHLCPNCLYDIEGLCEHWNDVKQCTECSERISPRLVCERWIERSRSASAHERVWLLAGGVGGALEAIVMLIMIALFRRLTGFEQLATLAPLALAGVTLFLVFRSAWKSQRLHDPLKDAAPTALIALGITGANAVVFLITACLVYLLVIAVTY